MRPVDVRIHNRAAILKIMKGRDSVTAAILVEATGLSLRTVQEILRELRAAKSVEVLSKGIYALARKPKARK